MIYNPDCSDCKLSRNTNHVCMYGKGPTKPKLMIVAEDLSELGDKTGKLLQGKAGSVIDVVLHNLDMTREDVYITNAIKCAVPDGDKPKQSEIKACKKYLIDEIRRIEPEVVVALGTVPMKMLLNISGVDKNRRRIFEEHDTKVVVTYHPSICFYKGAAFANEIRDDIMYALGELKENNIPFTWIDEIDWEEFITKDVTMDIETNDHVDPFEDGAIITEVSFCNDRNEVFFVKGQKNIIREVNEFIKLAVEKGTTVIGHNIKSDFKHLRYHGLDQLNHIKLKIFDTLIAFSHIDENYPNKGLEHLSQIWLGVPAWKHLYNDPTQRKLYSALDVVNNHALKSKALELLKEQNLEYIFWQDMETSKALVEIELNGMKVHETRLRNLDIRYSKAVKEAAALIPVENPNSTQQIAKLLYIERKFPIPENAYLDSKTKKKKKTIIEAQQKYEEELKEAQESKDQKRIKEVLSRKNQWKKFLATDETTIKDIMKEVEEEDDLRLLANVLRYRTLETMRNKFTHGWRIRVRKDGCLHGTYVIAKSALGDKDSEGGTVTGRLGMKEPNLMQVPRERITPEDEMADNLKKYGIAFQIESLPYDWNVKRCIISRFKGGDILQADADQAEMRGAANFSGDPVMIKIFLDGVDIHLGTAAAIVGVAIEEVTKFQRKGAKTINFGIVYGSSVWTMAIKADTTKEEMQKFFDAYIARFKIFWRWKKKEEEKILAQGYAKNVFGRIRHLPGVSRITASGRAKLREGINFLVQGPVAELTKYIMTKLTFKMITKGMKSLVIGNVHDAILADRHPEEREEVLRLVNYYAEKSHPLLKKYPIPFVFTKDIGPNWMDAKEIEDEVDEIE